MTKCDLFRRDFLRIVRPPTAAISLLLTTSTDIAASAAAGSDDDNVMPFNDVRVACKISICGLLDRFSHFSGGLGSAAVSRLRLKAACPNVRDRNIAAMTNYCRHEICVLEYHWKATTCFNLKRYNLLWNQPYIRLHPGQENTC